MHINRNDERIVETLNNWTMLSEINKAIYRPIAENLLILNFDVATKWSKTADCQKLRQLSSDKEDSMEDFAKKYSLLTTTIVESELLSKIDGLNDYEKSTLIFNVANKCLNHFELIKGSNPFQDNPFFTHIKVPNVSCGNFEFENVNQEAGVFVQTSEGACIFDDIFKTPTLGIYTDKITYPCIKEKGHNELWMSITHNELNTMKKHIDVVKGKVLTLGLGMGYYAYMVHLKTEVEKVTIVEVSSDVIKLFKENILPQFEYPEKIEIIQSDAYEFMDKLGSDTDFDYCFIDIWQGILDGFGHYTKFVKYEKKFDKMKLLYWIEDGIIDFARNKIFDVILNTLNPYWDIIELQLRAQSKVDKALEKEMSILDYLDIRLKDTRIRNESDLKNIMSDKYIKELIRNG